MIWLIILLILFIFLDKKRYIYLFIYIYIYIIINYKINYLFFFLPLFLFVNWFYYKTLIIYLLYIIFFSSALLILLLNQINLIWLILEVQSLSLIGLLFYDSKIKFFSLESIFKYFFLSTISSFIFLLFLIYLNYIELQNTFSLLPINIINISIILLYIVLTLKLGLAPFHIWVPEIYLGLSYICISFLGIIPKIIFFILFINLPQFNYFHFIILFLSIIIGVIGGINQSSIKKLIAFSGIYSGGVIFIAILSNNWYYLNSYFYLFNYLLFLSILLFIFLLQQKLDFIFEFKLSSIKNIYFIFFLLVILIAFIGLPPLSGFLAKWLIIIECIKANKYFYSLLIIISSIVSSFFYLRILNINLNIELNKFLLWNNIFHNNNLIICYHFFNYLTCFLSYYIVFIFIDPNIIINLFKSLLI